ncbi:hypothetical protein Tco_1553710 [Tanacetum coccineum]
MGTAHSAGLGIFAVVCPSYNCLLKPGGGISLPISCWYYLEASGLQGYCHYVGPFFGWLFGWHKQFGVSGVPRRGKAIPVHAVNRLIEESGDDVGPFNAFGWTFAKMPFNLFVRSETPFKTLVFRLGILTMALLLGYFGCRKTPGADWKVFSPHNCSWPFTGLKVIGWWGGPVSVDVDFGSALVMKRVSKTIGLLDAVAKINDPQSYVKRLLDRGLTAKWRLATLYNLNPCFGGLGVYSAGDVLNYAFIASRLQSAALQTKLLRDVGIVAPGSTFDDALCVVLNTWGHGELIFLSNPNGLVAISKGGSHFRLASCGTDFWAGTDYERMEKSNIREHVELLLILTPALLDQADCQESDSQGVVVGNPNGQLAKVADI